MDTKEEQIYALSRETFELKQQISLLKETIANKVLEIENLKNNCINQTPRALFEQMNRMVLEWQEFEDKAIKAEKELEAKSRKLEREKQKRKEDNDMFLREINSLSNQIKTLSREVETLGIENKYLHSELDKKEIELDVYMTKVKDLENEPREVSFLKYFENME